MFADYFTGLSDGRLRSGPFIIRWLILLAVFFGIAIGIGAAIGGIERIMGGSVAALRTILAENLGGPVAVLVLLMILVFVFAHLNITAKRARDVGLPGWLTAIVIGALSGGATQIAADGMGGLGLLLVIILAFLPTDMLRNS